MKKGEIQDVKQTGCGFTVLTVLAAVMAMPAVVLMFLAR
jgi:hypothetical protein